MPIRLAYQIIIILSQWILQIVSIFLPKEGKISKMLLGRTTSLKKLEQLPDKSRKRIWAHAASLGEYQMLLPLLFELEKKYDIEIHISFFSSSGYEHAENPGNWSFYYIQHDTHQKAKRFISLLKPDLTIFAKYEFWLNHLHGLNQRNIPFIYWNTLLREGHFLNKFWAQPWRKELNKALAICCQNQNTLNRVSQILPNTRPILTGDIRFLQTAEWLNTPNIFDSEIDRLLNSQKNIIWGSSWEEELKILIKIWPLNKNKYRFIVAPHDVSEKNLSEIETQLPGSFQRLSQWLIAPKPDVILLVDGIGKLRFLYRYAALAIIGGGFSNALHNIIEPLSNGVPVLFGDNHDKFPEAQDAIDFKAAIHGKTPEALSESLSFLLFHEGQDQRLTFHRERALEFFSMNMPKMDAVIPLCDLPLTK